MKVSNSKFQIKEFICNIISDGTTITILFSWRNKDYRMFVPTGTMNGIYHIRGTANICRLHEHCLHEICQYEKPFKLYWVLLIWMTAAYVLVISLITVVIWRRYNSYILMRWILYFPNPKHYGLFYSCNQNENNVTPLVKEINATVVYCCWKAILF